MTGEAYYVTYRIGKTLVKNQPVTRSVGAYKQDEKKRDCFNLIFEMVGRDNVLSIEDDLGNQLF